jgi:hypothetical protein
VRTAHCRNPAAGDDGHEKEIEMPKGVDELPSIAQALEDARPLVAAAPPPAPVATGWLCIDVPGEQAALELVERLNGFHAELAPAPGSGCEVRIEFEHEGEHEHGGDGRLVEAVRTVEDWLADTGISTAAVRIDGRCYLLESRVA